ncbi:MAG: NADPH-dependent F420 reductase [Actinomycetes bacterium]
MRIAVLGTGTVGRALGRRLAELGHTVTLGTRDPDVTRARPGIEEVPGIAVATFADAVVTADVVVVALDGGVVLEVLGPLAPHLRGTVLVDVTNPLDFSAGFPPTLSVKDTDSLAEQVQRLLPDTKVVKTLNTMNAEVMAHPERVGAGDHTVFLSGDNSTAKAVVEGLLLEMGHTDILDLGGIDTARGVEMFLPLWLRLMGALGTAEFQVKVVRVGSAGEVVAD